MDWEQDAYGDWYLPEVDPEGDDSYITKESDGYHFEIAKEDGNFTVKVISRVPFETLKSAKRAFVREAGKLGLLPMHGRT